MKHYVAMLALLSVLILAATSTLAIAEDSSAHLSGSMEVGVSGVDLKDNPARVNEYVNYRSKEDGVNPAGNLNLEYENDGVLLDLNGSVMGRRDQNYNLELDYNRIFKLDTEYQVFEHWKDHDNLGHVGATMFGDTAGEQPRMTTDATVGVIQGQATVDVAGANQRYYQELDQDYIITHKEWENEADITVPSLPNVTFHAGYRIEEREGLEQSRTLNKCNQCHLQANPKDVDEKTKDLTLGVTGKFGLITIDYEYLSRDFDDDSDGLSYDYFGSGGTHGGIPDADTLLYTSTEPYGQTPDSEKDSHTVKARLDLDRSSSVTATYVNADIESDKDGDSTYTLNKSSLKSEFESFFMKGATRIGGLRLSIRGGTYEIDGPEYTANFPSLADWTGPVGPNLDPALGYDTTTGDVHYESAESREVTEFGIDGVYRLAKGTTLRLGYEYEEIDRDEDELGDTETNTFDIAVNTRLNKKLSGRVSYKYQDIDEPLRGANTGIFQVSNPDPLYPGMAVGLREDYFDLPGQPNPGNTATAVYYWNSVYPNRELETSMDPEEVHEVKFSSTWTPSYNMAATVFGRYRHEENDPVNYKQDTFVPGVSFYYAPNDKMNLTMAYTFNKMETENQMCVGWYHG